MSKEVNNHGTDTGADVNDNEDDKWCDSACLDDCELFFATQAVCFVLKKCSDSRFFDLIMLLRNTCYFHHSIFSYKGL